MAQLEERDHHQSDADSSQENTSLYVGYELQRQVVEVGRKGGGAVEVNQYVRETETQQQDTGEEGQQPALDVPARLQEAKQPAPRDPAPHPLIRHR